MVPAGTMKNGLFIYLYHAGNAGLFDKIKGRKNQKNNNKNA